MWLLVVEGALLGLAAPLRFMVSDSAVRRRVPIGRPPLAGGGCAFLLACVGKGVGSSGVYRGRVRSAHMIVSHREG